ncbi:hypothetical protein QL285_015515 [Trifolium repens]|nr:hypothetical protein QL285_015515 [Trifolium repens]
MHTKLNADFYNERDNQSLVRHMHEFRNRRSNPLKPRGQVMPHRRYHQVKIATQMLPATQMLSPPQKKSHKDQVMPHRRYHQVKIATQMLPATQMLSPPQKCSHTDANTRRT